MKKCHTVVSLVLTLILSTASLYVTSSAIASSVSTTAESKITDALMRKFETVRSTTVTALVWLSDIDPSSAEAVAFSAVSMAAEERVAADAGAYAFSQSSNAIENEADLIQTYIEVKRDALVELYLSHNQNLANELMPGAEIIYISKCSPVVIVNLDEASAVSISQSSNVEFIDIYEEIIRADPRTLEYNANSIPLATVNSITRASDAATSASYGYTGEGVKIGIIEENIASTSEFSNLNIVATSGSESSNTHEENVLEIISSIAPDAEYYLAGLGTSPSYTTIMGKIEWLITTCKVNIIHSSYSFCFSENETGYGTTAKWIDHIAYQHDIHFVISSGNYGKDNFPVSAASYNAIAVGNLYVNGTPRLLDDTLWEGSAYNDGGNFAYKPDICAPGEGIVTRFATSNQPYFGGTSAAAPQVTGVIALLCEQHPDLKGLQNTVKAILTASVNFSSPHRYVPGSEEYKMYGAGLLDCVGACYVTGNYRYVTSSFPSGTISKTHTFTVTNSDTRIRVSLAFNIRSVASGDSHDTVTSGNITNLNIQVRDPNGNVVGASTTTNNNVEIVDFVPSITGTYTITVTRADASNETVYYALAWR